MNKDILVTIITPTYNHEKYIGQCIESVLSQTYPYWEQIIIDDGSIDNTQGIIAQYQDERIKYIRQENIGIWRLKEIYNRGLQLSQGTLIAILEGDDFWPCDKLEKQLPAFKDKGVILSWGKVSEINSKSQITSEKSINLKAFEKKKQCEMIRELIFYNFIPACTVICKKDALISIGGFKQPKYAPYVDYPTWLQLSLIGKFYPINEILGYWRRHQGQITLINMMNVTEAQNKCRIEFFNRLSRDVKKSLVIDINDLVKIGHNDISSIYISFGRINLIQKNWTDGRENFKKSWYKATLFTRLTALLGIFCSYLKVDMEWIALLMRKPQLYNLSD